MFKPRLSTRNPQKIILLGGSFDPAHQGHVHISLWAKKALGADQVWWMLTAQNPFKKRKAARLKDRFLQAQKISHSVSGLRVVVHESPYIFPFMQSIRKKNPRARFVFLMGADVVCELGAWKRWEDFLKICPLAIFPRNPYTLKCMKAKALLRYAQRRVSPLALWGQKTPCWSLLPLPLHPASSTQIRQQKD